MISLDLETSGLIPNRHQILSIGAVHAESNREFYAECYLLPNRDFQDKALEINGITEDQLNDVTKPSLYEIVRQFYLWVETTVPKNERLLLGQNIGQFDVQHLKPEYEYLGLPWQFGYHYCDLNSIGVFLSGECQSLAKMCKIVNVEPEPKIHNALTGAQKALEVYNKLRELLNS